MMVTAQGADHTVGNMPRLKSREMTLEQILDASVKDQVKVAAQDSLGFCIFGRTITTTQLPFIVNAINAAQGTQLTEEFFYQLGTDALKYEDEFNRQAGFSESDDDLPKFFYDEALPPTQHVARFRGADVHGIYARLN